ACGPSTPRDCDQTLYMNGVCYILNASLSVSKSYTPGYQDCQHAEVDLCFLFDGSSSMGTLEFRAILSFMNNAMRSLQNSTVQFAAVQFSHIIQPAFDFARYQRGARPRRPPEERHAPRRTDGHIHEHPVHTQVAAQVHHGMLTTPVPHLAEHRPNTEV
ncbi:integrin alpha-L-like, partial [Ascaphus truei]|uniref:integrin alpha-L-like n=1 Tax=Ascaphus truei TaxID=8439 RepID=UPI003F5A2544